MRSAYTSYFAQCIPLFLILYLLVMLLFYLYLQILNGISVLLIFQKPKLYWMKKVSEMYRMYTALRSFSTCYPEVIQDYCHSLAAQKWSNFKVRTEVRFKYTRWHVCDLNWTHRVNTDTYSVEQNPSWEANRLLASQEFPHILWDPKVHYRIHNCPSPVLILSQIVPIHIPTSHFLKIHFCIIFPSTPGSPKWSLSFRFHHQYPLYASPLPHTRYMSRLSHYSRFYHSNNIGWTQTHLH